jgi:CMP-N,N'-diacetyllegionaminic acid synthase
MSEIYALIPARGGSKRLPRKNIYPVMGKPMIMYSIEAAQGSRFLKKDNIYVSTEDAEIKEVVKPYVKVMDRPMELALDHVWTQDVVNHFAEQVKADKDDLIVIIQANSPQLTSEIIDQCIDMLFTNKLWQVHTVDENLINNGAVQVLYNFVGQHQGKVNYNGVVITNLVDVHTLEDVHTVERQMKGN